MPDKRRKEAGTDCNHHFSRFLFSVRARNVKVTTSLRIMRVPRDSLSPSRFRSNSAQVHPARPAKYSGLDLCNQSRPAASPNGPGPRASSYIAISNRTQSFLHQQITGKRLEKIYKERKIIICIFL